MKRTGAQLIADERRRQVKVEKWSGKHDDSHKRKQLARAAISYLFTWTYPDPYAKKYMPELSNSHWDWPWSEKYWKPSPDKIRNLVKAGALIAAEIDRLKRKKD